MELFFKGKDKKRIDKLFILFFFSLLFPFQIEAIDFIEVKDVKSLSLSKGTRIILEFSDKPDFKTGRLSNPERLYIDIKNAKFIKGFKAQNNLSDKNIKSIRAAQFDSRTVRIVFDMNISEYDFKIQNDSPDRLIIDIYSDQDNKKAEGLSPKDLPFLKKRIVLDPGHGGSDPGAIGSTGLQEKDVVLDIAKKVKEIIIKNYPDYEVIMTRNDDVFIPLNERTVIANKAEADLFVSIHANASPNRFARGIETFILNWTDDEESIKVAARENGISFSEMKKAQSELGFILASLERETKRDESIKLAGYIQYALVDKLISFETELNRGVKQALFYVLVGAKMPSALVEVGFISNPDEENLLSDESYRERIAQSIVLGINRYFISTQIGPQRIVMH